MNDDTRLDCIDMENNMSKKDEAIKRLQAKIAVCSMSADNDNYQVPMTIGEAKELIHIFESEPEKTAYKQPTDEEIHLCISAWDGDISEKEARYLLEINFWKSKASQAEPEPTEFTKPYWDRIKAGEAHSMIDVWSEWLVNCLKEINRLTAEKKQAKDVAFRRQEEHQERVEEIEKLKAELLYIQQKTVTLFEAKDRAATILSKP